MQIFILNGSDQVAVGKRLDQLKKEFSDFEVSDIYGEKITSDQLSKQIEGQSLFSSKRLIILKEPNSDTDLEVLPKDSENILVILASKDLGKKSTLLTQSKKHQIQIITLSKGQEISVFPFLDFLFERRRNAFGELEKLYPLFGSQYLLTMILYGLRRLVMKQKSDYMEQKLTKQRNLFPVDSLSNYYKIVLETDFAIKSGNLEERLGLSRIVQKIVSPPAPF